MQSRQGGVGAWGRRKRDKKERTGGIREREGREEGGMTCLTTGSGS
jgi:hypothetical protein